MASFSPLPSVIFKPFAGFRPQAPVVRTIPPPATPGVARDAEAPESGDGPARFPLQARSLVFANETGNAINPSNLRNRSFPRLLKRARLPADTRFHVLGEACDGEP